MLESVSRVLKAQQLKVICKSLAQHATRASSASFVHDYNLDPRYTTCKCPNIPVEMAEAQMRQTAYMPIVRLGPLVLPLPE